MWDWAAPLSTNDEERFLGFANYHRGLIAGYAQLAIPLYRLTGRNLSSGGRSSNPPLTL